eukprot:15207-Eustigmatos_ZCMA.PRE.1
MDHDGDDSVESTREAAEAFTDITGAVSDDDNEHVDVHATPESQPLLEQTGEEETRKEGLVEGEG